VKRRTDHLRGALLLISAGVVALAVAIIGLAMSSSSVQAQALPGETYTGDVGVITPNVCGGGTITLVVQSAGKEIDQIVLDGTYVGGVLVNTLPEPDGPFVVDLAPGDLTINGATGAFDGTIEPITGVFADVAGTFTGDTVTGTFGVPALQCVDIPFTAQVGGAGATPTATTEAPTEEPTAEATATVAATALPQTGAGPTSTDEGDGTVLWIALGIIGVASIAGGALALNKRRA
jgi:hypothetical protein